MSPFPTRSARRYHASLPIELIAGPSKGTFCTNSISATGCVVCGEAPAWLADACTVRIPLPRGKALDIQNVQAKRGSDGELHLSWKLEGDDAFLLTRYLRASEVEPSADARAQFLSKENELIHREILHLETERRRGHQFLMVLLAGYFTFTVAPYRVFTVLTVEMLAFYAITGFWVSVMLLVHCMRYSDFLSLSIRRRAHLYKALAGNRGWVFAHDPIYHEKGLLPLSSRYDDSLAWRATFSDNRERLAQWIKYHRSTVLFMTFLQAFFMLGCVYFVSLMMRGYELRFLQDVRVVPNSVGDSIDLFRVHYFLYAFSAFAVIPIVWLQLAGGKVLQFVKRIWEARRIAPGRPNPRFLDHAFEQQQTSLYRAFKFLTWGVNGYAIGGLLLLIPGFRAQLPIAPTVIYHPLAVVLVCMLVAIGKWLHGVATLSAARLADGKSRPIREMGEAKKAKS